VSSIKEFAIRWLQRRIEMIDVWALRGVSLDVEQGEMFGLIGRNGVGKSTLLKVVAGLLHPTEGRAVVRGAVSPLLELGAGFHPELTGRENVYLYGTLLGYTRRQIQEGFEDMIEFADLWDFVDAPLRSYSAGMIARLGFAVATYRLARVLLVDEVLAVGDIHFQQKCLERMEAYRAEGASILLVSHDMGVVRSHCDRAGWLEGGELKVMGEAPAVVNRFIEANQG
jgi:ABC-type polysaccharide/polyol phosphate transport system ATPase subunit